MFMSIKCVAKHRNFNEQSNFFYKCSFYKFKHSIVTQLCLLHIHIFLLFVVIVTSEKSYFKECLRNISWTRIGIGIVK